MSNYENLMYAAQGLTLPCCEHSHGGEDASLPLSDEEQDKIINQRLNHPMFPKTSRTKIEEQSAEFFGDGKELPYVVDGEENWLTVVQK